MTDESKAVVVRENGGALTSEKTRALWAAQGSNLSPEASRVLGMVGDHYDLSPALGEVMILGNKVYVSLEGYLTIAQRHSAYRGYELRPMTDQERKEAKVGADEHAWVAKVYRDGWPHPSVGYGVAKEDRIPNANIRQFARELAESRAFRRALRGAFRVNVTEDEMELADAGSVTNVRTGEPMPAVSVIVNRDTGEIVDAIAVDVGEPPAPTEEKPVEPDFTTFWATVKAKGLKPKEVHELLGVTSLKDWQGSLLDAIERVDRHIAARDFKPRPSDDDGHGRSLDQMRAEATTLYDKAESLGEPLPHWGQGSSREALAEWIGKARQHVRGLEAQISLFGPGDGQ